MLECNIADDVILQVENPKNDTFSSDEESYSEVENEDLDYIDGVEEIDVDGEQIFPDCEDQRSIEQVDLEVNFAFKRSGGQNQAREATPQADNPQPNELEDYVQRIVNNKWKEKEAELLEKYGLNKGMENKDKMPQKNETQTKFKEVVKCPSDTTLYTPALQRMQNRGVVDKLIFQNKQVPNENVVVDHVANFVEGVRAEVEVAKRNNGNLRDQEEAGLSTGRREAQTKKDRVNEQADFAKNLASEQVIAAEKFKSDINQTQGKSATLDINQPFEKLFIETGKKYFAGVERPRNDCEIIEDDDFFHITCHVEKALTQKIKKGEYVDLERLLVCD